MILPTLANGLINGNYVLTRTNANVCELPVWCLYLVKDNHALENVQRRASRLILNQRKVDVSYEDRCKLLKWSALSDRRTYLSLV